MAAQATDADLAAQEILDVLSTAVMAMGPLLLRAHRVEVHFDDWVERNLPIAPRTAKRILAMYLCQIDHPHGELPEPWMALWTLE